jgi:periplasmic protein TonB
MFDTLLASNFGSEPRMRAVAGAFVLHLGIVIAAVRATAAGPAVAAVVRDTIHLEMSFPPPQPRRWPLPPDARRPVPAPPLPRDLPPGVPLLDLTRFKSDFPRFDPRILSAAAPVQDLLSPRLDRTASVYSVTEVDQLPELLGGLSPAYPEALRRTGMNGAVVLEYVVSASGRVEPGSVRVVRSTHPAFSAAAADALLNARFKPAHRSGQAVPVLVQQTIRFVFR